MEHTEQVPAKVREIYKIVTELEDMFGPHSTADGHMVGIIGEILAEYHYAVDLLPASAEKHDAVTKDGTNVEVLNGPGALAWEEAGNLPRKP